MAKNQFAVQMMAAKAAMKLEERRALVHRCMTTVYQASGLALSQGFDFQPDDVRKFRDLMEQIIIAYGVEMEQADVEYADANLEEAYLRMMGEYYK